jgi:hypothetical protein
MKVVVVKYSQTPESERGLPSEWPLERRKYSRPATLILVEAGLSVLLYVRIHEGTLATIEVVRSSVNRKSRHSPLP